MKKLLLPGLLLCCRAISAQNDFSTDSAFLIRLNQTIDHYVIEKNIPALDSLYAYDFVFSHGTGLIEGKEGWMKTVRSVNNISRLHDSVNVELHPGTGIVRGKLSVKRKANTPGEPDVTYWIKYIRVYARRNGNWQLISHITTHEFHMFIN